MDIDLLEVTHHASWVMTIFLLGYVVIIAEEIVKFNKTATALLMAIGCWTILFLEPADSVERHLFIFTFQMFKVSQVLFFLMGALTIVEIINAHRGFNVITQCLLIRSKRKLLWLIGIITFFMSSILDNLTTTIVMVSLVSKLINDREERLILGGVIVIAANAGGAWTPIGDVATTLLWIYNRVTTGALVRDLFLPSFSGLVVCLVWFTYKFKGRIERLPMQKNPTEPGGTLILLLGICALIFVPFFRALTDLPAFMGMMLGLGIVWTVTDLIHYRYPDRKHLRVVSILPRVDLSVILFYLGILLSVNSLESAGLLKQMSLWLNQHVYVSTIPVLIGLVSSVVDNVSLVAATIGMYGIGDIPIDAPFWQVIAYAAGAGGSIFVLGSAAGIALMALEGVSFGEYMKKATVPALLAYFGGIFIYLLLSPLTQKFL